MCQNAVKDGFWRIADVPNWLKMTEMCNGLGMAGYLGHVSDLIKTKEMCNEAVRRVPDALGHVPDHFKTGKMCEKAFEKDLRLLKYVPDWLVTDQKKCQVMKHISGRHCLFEDIIK